MGSSAPQCRAPSPARLLATSPGGIGFSPLTTQLGTIPMLLGYNTNGFAHHDLLEAIDVLAEIGYRSIALTLDQHTLNPFEDDLDQELDELQRRLKWHGFRSVIETGARFLLDPRIKHEPTLVSPSAWDRARRIEFLCRAIDIAKRLGSDCVSFWSGVVRDGAEEDEVWKRLVEGVQRT